MEKKFHINDKGDAGLCRASVKPCRFSPEENPNGNHYPTRTEALQAASEKFLEKGFEDFAILTKTDYSNSTYELEVVPEGETENGVVFNAWMKRDEVNVSYFQGFHGTTEYGDGKGGYTQSEVQLVSWTVETNPKYRNQGVARQLIKELKKHFGVSEVMSGGSYPLKVQSFGQNI